MDELVNAVRQLRFRLNLSQQAFATRLGLSISAIANYERDRRPTQEVLSELKKLAEANGLAELANTFQGALGRAVIEIPPGKEEDFDALMTILLLGGKQNREALAEWNRISAPIKEVNRTKDLRASAIFGLHKEIRRRINDGESDDDIVRALPAWQPDIVKMQIANMRELDKLNTAATERSKKK
jgi:transcriptional regulator with XRE-family HTH domain